jgi:mannose-6-phosphate isomerase-like protein (cupin superfamily)
MPLPIPFGGSVTIKAHTRNTNGSLTVLEFVHPPKAGPALHTHFREDEVWYVLEGNYRFKVGEAMFRVSEGGMAFGPRGAPHGFQNIGDTPGRLLVIATPSGVERFFEQCAELLPDPLDTEALAAIMRPTGLSRSAHRSAFPIRSSRPGRERYRVGVTHEPG